MQKSTQRKLMGGGSMILRLIAVLAALACIFCSCRSSHDDDDDVYTITLDANGGKFTDTGEATMTMTDKNITLPSGSDVTREGYTFIGWAENKNATEADYTDSYKPTSDITLYAVWKEVPAGSYALTLNANGGTFTDGAKTKTVTVTAGEHYTLSTDEPTLVGHRLLGWAATSSAMEAAYTDTYTPKDNTTLYAVWEQIIITVTLDANGGTFTDGEKTKTVTVTVGEHYTLPTDEPTREGYKLLGWAATSSATEATYTTSYTPTADTTLYAVWEQIITVTLNANGGTFTGGAKTKTVTVTAGESIKLPTASDLTRDGYVFIGWAENENAEEAVYTESYEPTSDITLYAVWKEVPADSCVLTLNANGGTFPNGMQTKTETVHIGEVYTFPTDEPTRKGYKLLGWAEASDATEATYMTSYTPTDNTTLYAVWGVHTYTIAFDANGGHGTMSPISATYGEDVTLPKNAFTAPDGMVFGGWAREKNAAEREYGDGATVINLTEEYDATVTLYAVWLQGQALQIRITFVDGDEDVTVSYDTSKKIITITPPMTDDTYEYSWSITTHDNSSEPIISGTDATHTFTSDELKKLAAGIYELQVRCVPASGSAEYFTTYLLQIDN